MAWEWVSPVASATSAIVAAGIAAGFTWYTGHQGRKHVEKVAEQSAASQLALAREARRAAVYSDVYKTVARVSVVFLHESAKGPPPLSISDIDEWVDQIVNCNTQVGLYGSPEVLEIYSEWERHLDVLHNRERRRAVSRANESGNALMMQEDYEEACDAVGKARRQLKEQMNRELTS